MWAVQNQSLVHFKSFLENSIWWPSNIETIFEEPTILSEGQLQFFLAFEDCFKIMKLLWYYCVLKWNEPVLFLVKFIPKLLDHKTNIKILSTLAIQSY